MKKIFKIITLIIFININILSAKVIDTTSSNNINSSLNSFYNSLDKADTYIHNTNKFNCNNNICITSNYNKIGLLSLYEYNNLNYLTIPNSWFILDNTTIKNIENNISINITDETTSSLRPSVYLKNGVYVTGSGTINDPWRLITDGTHDPIEYYKVTLNVINGTSDITEVTIAKGTSAVFNITPNDGYKIGSLVCNGSNKSFSTDSENNIKISSITENMSCTLTLVSKGLSLKDAILRDNKTINTRTDFSTIFTRTTTGTIYKTTETEDGSTVYYYAGNTTNNWVKFGNFYWRIIRTNEDNSVRLLYSGISHDTTSAVVGSKSYYNSEFDVGYMINNNTTDSIQKEWIDNWYKDNLLTNYDKYISKSAIYCNDRSISKSSSGSIKYGPYQRLESSYVPSYKCGGDGNGGIIGSSTSLEDKFSVSTSSGGNGLLTYPVGAMTADEISFAGGAYLEDLTSPYIWYYTNSKGESITGEDGWWTMTPSEVSGNYFVFIVRGSDKPGRLFSYHPGMTYYYRPVISIKYCTTVSSGNGTPTNPYTLNIDTECSNKEN